MIGWVDVVGIIAASASIASFTPQAWKIIRERSTEGLSAGMFALTAIAFAGWFTYGLMNGSWPLAIQNGVCFLFASFILGMILLPRRKTEELAEKLDPTGDEA